MKKYISVIGLLLLGSIATYAQVKQEVGGYLAGGMSTIDFKGAEKRVNDKMGYAAGVSYRYFLNDNWAVQSGLEVANYNSKVFLNNIAGSIEAIDDEGESFDYRYSMGGYKEKQYTYLLNVPIMINYNTVELTKRTNLYASAGVKLGIPLSSKYKTDISSVKASGYYPSTNVTYDDLTFRGFGVFSDLGTKDKISTNFQVISSLEVGLKNQLGNGLYVYTGLYFDYGLTSFASQKKTFVQYNTMEPKTIHNESILNSAYNKDGVNEKLVKNSHLMAFGLKVNVAFEL